jgi:ribosome biogenesis GTPase
LNLTEFGWSAAFAEHLQRLYPQSYPGRVSAEYRSAYRLLSERGECLAEIDGKLRFAASCRRDFPAVGDWVAFTSRDAERATIHGVLPRRSCIVRRAAGSANDEQVLAANVDTLFLVSALNGEFNLRRIERYVALALASDARPVIVLNKADLCRALPERLAELKALERSVPVHVTSAAYDDTGSLGAYLTAGSTIALLGSSGVGKSTLANVLAGSAVWSTGAIRAGDDRGKHTTTARSLLKLASGALLIDTPGLRELQLLADEEALDETFADVVDLARRCRFSDCGHNSEPGCAVRPAIGVTLDEARWRNYCKLQREAAFVERKSDVQVRNAEKQRWKKLTRAAEERMKFKRR